MLAAHTSESILGGESRREPLGRWARGQAGPAPALVPAAARVTLKGAWQTLRSRRACSLAVIHVAMQQPSAQSRPGTVIAFIPAKKGDAILSWVRDQWSCCSSAPLSPEREVCSLSLGDFTAPCPILFG